MEVVSTNYRLESLYKLQVQYSPSIILQSNPESHDLIMYYIRVSGGNRVGLTYGPITSSIDDKKARRRMYNTSAPIVDINKLKCGPNVKEGGSGESLSVISKITLYTYFINLPHTFLC